VRDETWHDYTIGFSMAGQWREVFTSDVYNNWVNPIAAGSGGVIEAVASPMHGFTASAQIVIPAKTVVVFTAGDD
jgi:1,4-alpha-glucan branching enzyme